MGTRIHIFSVVSLCLSILGIGAAVTRAQLFEPMKQSCADERAAYCRAAMPTDSRLALCLYAHEDKLSTQCGIAVYGGIVGLHLSLNALSTYAKSCRSDLLKFCATIKWGEGRLYDCLTENNETLTLECRIALNGARPELQTLGIEK